MLLEHFKIITWMLLYSSGKIRLISQENISMCMCVCHQLQWVKGNKVCVREREKTAKNNERVSAVFFSFLIQGLRSS